LAIILLAVRSGGPINTRNGNLSYQEVDLVIPVRGESLAFRRAYASGAVDTYTTTTYHFDGNGRLLQQVDASGNTIIFSYNNDGRLYRALQEDRFLQPAIAVAGNGSHLVTWRDGRNRNGYIYGQRLDDGGNLQGNGDGQRVQTVAYIMGIPTGHFGFMRKWWNIGRQLTKTGSSCLRRYKLKATVAVTPACGATSIA
jgi:YD repeat-containing protein